MLSTLLIALREGLEASLIVGILIAYLARSGLRNLILYLWIGVATAGLLTLGVGAILSFTSATLSKRGEELFAGVTSLAAVTLVTWMVFWMKKSARGLSQQLQGRLAHAIPIGRIALVFAAFFAVAREGLETALFVYANFKTVGSDATPTIGLIVGLIVAIGLGVGIYKRSIKIDLAKFFKITGSALILIAAGVLSHGIHEFQNLGLLPGSGAYIWNFGAHDSVIATILDGTVGISTILTWLQFLLWGSYLGITLSLYLKRSAPVNLPISR